jgi:Cu-processing system permease protein
MNTASPTPAPRRSSPPGFLSNASCIAARELRDAVSSRWFVLYVLAFAGLGLAVSFVSAGAAGGSGFSGFGRTTAGLINLVLLVVPLMALTAGAGSVASDRERGMLAYVLSQPVSRTELLLGKYAGLAAALLACLCLGLGLSTLLLAWRGHASGPAAMLWLAGLSLCLTLSMLALGFLISVLARKSSVATGTVFVWLLLVFGSDLGLLAGSLAFRLRIEHVFGLCLANPLQVFKMWSLTAIGAPLDVLGPAGLYAQDEFGPRVQGLFAASLTLWAALPLALAAAVFARRSPV